MSDNALRVAVIIGSTREGRIGDTIGRWFAARVAQRDDLAPTVVDLAAFDFPSRYPDVPTASMVDFTAQVAAADAFVLVTPEYNRSFPASLKQAIDYAYDEWQAKPVGFVSYGWRSGGMYAVEQLRTVFTELHVVTMRNGVSFNLLDGGFDAGGEPVDGDTPDQDAKALLDQLTWWGVALRDARLARPYVS